MPEELGKIVRPSVEDFQKGRKLFFVPLIYSGKESSAEFTDKLDNYWRQVEEQLSDLELKLGQVSRIYHELIPSGGEEGLKALKDLNEKSHQAVQTRVDKGSQLEASEDAELLTEVMDWSRCLAIGLQNQKVLNTVYQSYVEAGKKRDEFVARRIDETLKENETGILFMREGHQVQFPSGVEVFYVAPPSLDEIKRWVRDSQSQRQEEGKAKARKGKSRRSKQGDSK
jgi:hypothetical protein